MIYAYRTLIHYQEPVSEPVIVLHPYRSSFVSIVDHESRVSIYHRLRAIFIVQNIALPWLSLPSRFEFGLAKHRKNMCLCVEDDIV